jgi:hypothetical protein
VGPKWIPKVEKSVLWTLKKRGAPQGGPSKKHLSRVLVALANCIVVRLQLVYLLGVLQPREGTSKWLDTFVRLKLKSLSWESASLTYHCRELVLLANLW